MAKQSKDGEIFTRPWTEHHTLITNPTVLTVTAIKRKYVEQLPVANYADLWDAERYSIVGRVASGSCVVLKETGGTGNLYKVRDLDYRQYLMELYRRAAQDEGKEYTDVQDEILARMQANMENMPQLFEE